ncbi:MAG: hypothetical protein WAV51_00205 [Microgenomates group bacterium]
MKTFWNEMVETWKVMWKAIVKSWYTKEPLFGLPRKVCMIYVAVLGFGIVHMIANVLIFADTPLHRLENEFFGHMSIVLILLVVYPIIRENKPPTQTKHWLILGISIVCLLVGVGTRLVNAWFDAKVIMPWLALFLIPGEAFFVLWIYGVKPSRNKKS